MSTDYYRGKLEMVGTPDIKEKKKKFEVIDESALYCAIITKGFLKDKQCMEEFEYAKSLGKYGFFLIKENDIPLIPMDMFKDFRH